MEKEKKTFSLKKGGLIWIIWNLVEALLLITMGVLTIVNCQKDSLHKELFIIISIFLIVGGSLRILANFIPIIGARKVDAEGKLIIRMNMSYSMCISGAIELALGIALMVAMTGDAAMMMVQYITDIIVYFASILLIVAGATLIAFAIAFIITKLYKLYVPIVEIVFGLATAGLGIVILVLFAQNSQIIVTILLVIIGVLLILAGIGEAVLTFRPLIKARKKAKKQTNEDMIDAEVKESGEQEEKSVKKEEEPLVEDKPLLEEKEVIEIELKEPSNNQ